MPTTNLISAKQLQSVLRQREQVILDCSWYLPSQQRDTFEEYASGHIPGAQFFDIDTVCDASSELPHMLPSARQFAHAAAALGVGPQSRVLVYDSAGVFSAARVWWMFRVFGHNNVQLLNGGLPAWRAIEGQLDTGVVSPRSIDKGAVNSGAAGDAEGGFVPNFLGQHVVQLAEMKAASDSASSCILDARSAERFAGSAPEPRPELRSGHMPNSTSLPFQLLLHNGHLRPKHELQEILRDHGVSSDIAVITSCGSGVTAAIVSLALDEAGFGLHKLYDGAWSEWASSSRTTILTLS